MAEDQELGITSVLSFPYYGCLTKSDGEPRTLGTVRVENHESGNCVAVSKRCF